MHWVKKKGKWKSLQSMKDKIQISHAGRRWWKQEETPTYQEAPAADEEMMHSRNEVVITEHSMKNKVGANKKEYGRSPHRITIL